MQRALCFACITATIRAEPGGTEIVEIWSKLPLDFV
jgi:hypothetical protein